jgi:hypothetical protein
MSEGRTFIAILSIAMAVAIAAGWLDWVTGQGGVRVLTGVIAGATVAYTGLTWRLVQSAAKDRRERIAAEQVASRRRLRAAQVELEANVARSGKTHVWHAHVPFSRSALDESRSEWPGLPDGVRDALGRAERDIARHNALVNYHRVSVRPGSGAGDKELERLADEVVTSCDQAAAVLSGFMRP